jgi:hypothetical protein
MNKLFLLILFQTTLSLFIPSNYLPKLRTKACINPQLTYMKKDNKDNDFKNKSQIFKIKFNNDNLENNENDIYLIVYRIYIYLLIFINWVLIVYIIQNT